MNAITDCRVIDENGIQVAKPNLRLGIDNFSIYLTQIGEGQVINGIYLKCAHSTSSTYI